jgi:hypothetical protein
MAWTSLDVPEVDRIWNFQVVLGAGIKRITRRGPGLMLEFRNHHISNAGTRGENSGSTLRWWLLASTGCCGKPGPTAGAKLVGRPSALIASSFREVARYTSPSARAQDFDA